MPQGQETAEERLSVRPARKSQFPIWKQKEFVGQGPSWDL